MKTLALFGGSGKTGQQFLPLALEKGYRIKALARTPQKISQSHPDLELVQGDVLNLADVQRCIHGTEGVVSLFGQVKGSPAHLQTQGTQNIVEAMKAENIRRIISLSGAGVPYEKDEPKFADHLIRGIMKIFASNILNDGIQHVEVLRQSGLDWTVVRGPRLTDAPAKGSYQVAWVGQTHSTQIGRADLAAFILSLVESGEYIHELPFVSQ